LYAFSSFRSICATCTSHLILLDFITPVMLDKAYKLWNCFLQPLAISF
jgi:hypothetical protein